MPTNLILLAAGAGTRMQSDLPKVLHKVGGAALFAHALTSAAGLSGRRVVVVGHGGEAVRTAVADVDPDIAIVEQAEQLGTGHAVRMAAPALDGAGGDTAILYGDTPFIRPETLERMQSARAAGADVVFLGFEAADPGRYGRLVTEGTALLEIVEWKDADAATRAITLCNSGVVLAETDTLLRLIDKIGNDNAAGEYYLTDLAALARAEGASVEVVTCDEAETLGINSRSDLAVAETVFQARARAEALTSGVTLEAPDTVFFSMDTRIDRDVVVEPNVVFGPGVRVDTGARIRAFSHLEGCHVGAGAVVGPYARLRPGADLAGDVRIGNFVEVKNARIGEGAKVNHLSYIGDAAIGAATNVGAGTVTCNYDGVFKHHTEIGAGVFIGSSTMLVAPVTVGDEAMTASGSVITEDVPAGDLAFGRTKQVNKPGLARKLFSKLREAKAARQKG